MNISRITDDYAVAAQIAEVDVAVLAANGCTAVICNRPDDEDPGQPSAAAIEAACNAHDLDFFHIPVTGLPIEADAVFRHRQIVASSDGWVLAYCRSGQRSLVIFQAGGGHADGVRGPRGR